MKIRLVILFLLFAQFTLNAQNCSFVENIDTVNNRITFTATDTLSAFNYIFIVDTTSVLTNLTGGHSATYQGFLDDTLTHSICFKIVDLINQVLICENCTTFSLLPVIPPDPTCGFSYYFSNDTLYAAHSGSVTPADFVWEVNGNTYPGTQLVLYLGNSDSVEVTLNGQNVQYGISCSTTMYAVNQGYVPVVNHCTTDFEKVANALTTYFIDITSNNNPLQSVYYWNFGDGNYSSARNVEHTYLSDGDYTVCFWVKDTLDASHCNDTICKLITVSSTLPVADTCSALFVFTQLQAYNIAAVNLASGINPQFSWNFGDGPQSIVTGPYPGYTYMNAGTYEVCLTLTTDSCNTIYCDSLTVDTVGLMRGGNQGFTINVLSPAQVTGLNEKETILNTMASIEVYPNPGAGIFSISAAANIEVYNLIGELVLSENNTTRIDLTDAPNGLYFVRLNGDAIKKLIKN